MHQTLVQKRSEQLHPPQRALSHPIPDPRCRVSRVVWTSKTLLRFRGVAAIRAGVALHFDTESPIFSANFELLWPILAREVPEPLDKIKAGEFTLNDLSQH